MTLGLGQNTLTEDELEDLTNLLFDLAACDNLNDWEANFVDDMQERVDRFKRRTLISDAQQEQLDRMKAKYLGRF